jgi:hypothetical protein
MRDGIEWTQILQEDQKGRRRELGRHDDTEAASHSTLRFARTQRRETRRDLETARRPTLAFARPSVLLIFL